MRCVVSAARSPAAVSARVARSRPELLEPVLGPTLVQPVVSTAAGVEIAVLVVARTTTPRCLLSATLTRVGGLAWSARPPRLDVDRVAAILADSLRTPGGRGGRPPVAPGPTLSCNSSRASPTVKLGRSASNPTPTGRHAASGDSAPRVLPSRPNQQYVAASPIFAVPGQSRDRDEQKGANESSLAASLPH